MSIRSLEKVETDLDGKIVYVDLQTTRKDSPSETKTLLSLLNHLNEIKPSDTTLGRMAPQGRKNRLFVAIVDRKAHTLLRAWFLCAIRRVSELRELILPLGSHILVLGGQFVVPKRTEACPKIDPQSLHIDNSIKGELVSVAINLANAPMGTLLNAKLPTDPDSLAKASNEVDYGKAMSPVFAFDLATAHAGPGCDDTAKSFPQYDTTRVYFDLCAVSLDSDRIADIRARNGFKSGCDLVIKMPKKASRSTMLCNRPVKSIKRLNPVELDQEKCLAAKAGKAAKAAAKADKPTKASQPSEKNEATWANGAWHGWTGKLARAAKELHGLLVEEKRWKVKQGEATCELAQGLSPLRGYDGFQNVQVPHSTQHARHGHRNVQHAACTQGTYSAKEQQHSTLRIYPTEVGHAGREHPPLFNSQPRLGDCMDKVPCIRAFVEEGVRLVRTHADAECAGYDAQILKQQPSTAGAAVCLGL